MFKGEYEIIVNPDTERERVYKCKNMIIRGAKTITFGNSRFYADEAIYTKADVWVYRYEIDDDTFRNIYYATDSDDISKDLYIGRFAPIRIDKKVEKSLILTTDTQVGPIDIYGVYLEWYFFSYPEEPLAISRIDPPISLTASDTYVIRYSIKMEW
ncbi:MAG: hypothetical protein ACTSR2_00365 [Candidatus Hodarchaeales archaeon]